MTDKYLETLEEKRENAENELESGDYAPIEELLAEINTYTDCIEIYKSMKESKVGKWCEGCSEYDNENHCCHRFHSFCEVMDEERNDFIKELQEENEKLKKELSIYKKMIKKVNEIYCFTPNECVCGTMCYIPNEEERKFLKELEDGK